MIWIFVIIIIVFLLFKFFIELDKDNYDLQNQNLPEKFYFIVSMINQEAYNGEGSVTILDKRTFNLYQDGENQIINFQYSTGHLTITWKYKYFQKEVVHERQFNDVRNLSVFEQQKIAGVIIKEMSLIIEKHKLKVLNHVV